MAKPATVSDPGGISGYLVTVIATTAMVLLRWLMDPWMGDNLPFVTLFGAVAAAVYYGGYRPALVATGLGYLACEYLFIEPRGSFAIRYAPQYLGLVLYLFTCSVITGLGEALRSAQRRSGEQLELLRVTFASIGDAVITTDTAGRVTSLNPMAESLTGWTTDEAAGRPLEKVVRIVNEQTRETAENPVRKALAEGRIVGLANHTVLIAKDGTERPIDDSASPIRDVEGRILGVVLVFRDVTERKRAEEALKEADRRKDEFLATLAHELRNPLAPLRNALELLRRAEDPDPRVERARSVMERQVGMLARLVDDLLDVNRITRGRLQLQKERVELAAVLHGAVETSRPLLEASAHELTVTLPSEPVYLDADAVRLTQVFSNLLNNAAKFTEKGGRIRLTAEQHDGEAVVAVKDSGIGITADHLSHIFEMFSQVETGLERSQGGLGIGLSLVKGLVELHGGRVEAESDGPGQGSEFTVHLPNVAVPARAPLDATGDRDQRSPTGPAIP